jgi:hypothetical protein
VKYDIYEKYNAIIFGVLAQILLTPLHAKTNERHVKVKYDYRSYRNHEVWNLNEWDCELSTKTYKSKLT